MLKILHACQRASGNNLYKVTRETKCMHMYTMDHCVLENMIFIGSLVIIDI